MAPFVSPFAPMSTEDNTISPPLRQIRRAQTISHHPVNSSSASSSPFTSRRPSRNSSNEKPMAATGGAGALSAPAAEGVDLLWTHDARIVSFNIREKERNKDGKVVANKEPANYIQPTERTMSVGTMRLYRVKFQTTFLQSGQLLHPLLPRTACWCVDDARGMFVMRIRSGNYWRLEIQDVENNRHQVDSLKEVLNNITVFEKTPCPFRVEVKGEIFEEQAPLPVFRKKSFAERGIKRRGSLNSDFLSGSMGSENNSFTLNTLPDVPAITPAPFTTVKFRRDIFESRKPITAPRPQGPENIPLPLSPVVMPESGEDGHFDIYAMLEPRDHPLPATDDETDDVLPAVVEPIPRIVSMPNQRFSPTSPFDIEFSFAADIATGRASHDRNRNRLSSPPTGVIRIPKRASHVIDLDSAATLRQALDSSPPATPALSLCGTDSDIDGWTDIATPETSARYRSLNIGERPGTSSSDMTSGSSILIEDSDPDYVGIDLLPRPPAANSKYQNTTMDIIDRTASISPPRSLTSIAHRTTHAIFSKTIDLAIHRPSSFLTAFMLRVAGRIVRGATVYTYYLGDWKDGQSQSGDVVGHEGVPSGAAGGYDGTDEFEEEEEEDDFGVKILGRKRGDSAERRVGWDRRRSAPDLTTTVLG